MNNKNKVVSQLFVTIMLGITSVAMYAGDFDKTKQSNLARHWSTDRTKTVTCTFQGNNNYVLELWDLKHIDPAATQQTPKKILESAVKSTVQPEYAVSPSGAGMAYVITDPSMVTTDNKPMIYLYIAKIGQPKDGYVCSPHTLCIPSFGKQDIKLFLIPMDKEQPIAEIDGNDGTRRTITGATECAQIRALYTETIPNPTSSKLTHILGIGALSVGIVGFVGLVGYLIYKKVMAAKEKNKKNNDAKGVA